MAAPRPPDEDDDLGAAIGIYAMIAEADAEAVPQELRRPWPRPGATWKAQEPSTGRLAAVAEAIDLLLAAGSRV